MEKKFVGRAQRPWVASFIACELLTATFQEAIVLVNFWRAILLEKIRRTGATSLSRGFFYNSRRNKYKKNGAPIIAIKIPTGNSVGAKIVRVTVSLNVTTAAPKNAALGSKNL